jgi:phosphoenolpyruvate synthase/pyruvate phosphate dikinase
MESKVKIYIKYFNKIGINDIPQVECKDASLGEIYQNLSDKSVTVTDGFALTGEAPQKLVANNLSVTPVLEDEQLLGIVDIKGINELISVKKH